MKLPMNHDSVTFLLSAPLSDSDLLTWLLAQGTGKTEPHVTVDRIYYDTFDWRLYLAGSVVESTAEGPGLRLQWRPLEHGDLLGEWQAEHAPSFADDLPSAPFRQQLASLIAPRTLLPQAHVRSEQTAIRLQNSKRRTIARLIASDHRLVDEEGNGEQALPSTLEIAAPLCTGAASAWPSTGHLLI